MNKDKINSKYKDLAEFYGYRIPLNEFFQCSLSVDCVVFGYHHNDVKVLLIKRGAEPFMGKWALPGDLMYPDENLNCAAMRVLRDLTGIENLFMEQAHTFGEKDRHPIGRVITVSYYALVNIEDYNPKPHSWAKDLEWHSLSNIPELAFDHRNILSGAMQKLRTNLWSRPVGLNMLPQKFTLNDVQQLYELILSEKFDKANFRKRMLNSDFITPLEEQQSNVRHRPAKLYKLTDNLNPKS